MRFHILTNCWYFPGFPRRSGTEGRDVTRTGVVALAAVAVRVGKLANRLAAARRTSTVRRDHRDLPDRGGLRPFASYLDGSRRTNQQPIVPRKQPKTEKHHEA